MIRKGCMGEVENYVFITIKGKKNIEKFYSYYRDTEFSFTLYKSYATYEGKEVVMAILKGEYARHSKFLNGISTVK